MTLTELEALATLGIVIAAGLLLGGAPGATGGFAQGIIEVTMRVMGLH
jgi:hypothetical protein